MPTKKVTIDNTVSQVNGMLNKHTPEEQNSILQVLSEEMAARRIKAIKAAQQKLDEATNAMNGFTGISPISSGKMRNKIN